MSLHNDTHDIAADENMSRITGHENLPEEFDLDAARKSNELILIKTHAPPVHPDDRFIYLVRDGRASCWSYAHYRLDYHDADYLDKSLEEVIRGEVVFGSWAEHLESWSPLTNPNALLVRFEDLVTDTENVVSRLEEFLGITAKDASVPEFSELQALNSKFFRSGSTDSWRDGFPPRLLELFWLKNSVQMHSYGYQNLAPEKTPGREELITMLHAASIRRVKDVRGAIAKKNNSRANAALDLALERIKEDFELVKEITKSSWDDTQIRNRETVGNLTQQLQSETTARIASQRELSELRAENQESIAALTTELKEAETKFEQELAAFNKQLEDLTKERENLLQKEITLTQERDTLLDESQALHKQRGILTTERDNLQISLAETKARLDGAELEKEAISKRNQNLLNQQDTLRDKLTTNSEALNDLDQQRTEVFELFEALADSRALFSPRKKYQRYGALIRKLREQLDSSRDSKHTNKGT